MNLQNQINYLKECLNEDMFDGCTVPAPLDINAVRGAIILRCGLRTPLYSEPEVQRLATQQFFATNQWNFEHIVKIIEAEYSPIENVAEWREEKTTNKTADVLTIGTEANETNSGQDARKITESGSTGMQEEGNTTTQESGTTGLQKTGKITTQESGTTGTQETGSTTTQESGTTETQESGTTGTQETGSTTTQESGTTATVNEISAENALTYQADNQQSVTHGKGETVTHGKGEAVTHGKGETVTHGKGEAVTHGKGETVTHGKTETVDRNEGETVTHGKGETVTHGKGETVTHGKIIDDVITFGKIIDRTSDEKHKRDIEGGTDFSTFRHGNIGVTTNQDLINQELDLLERFNPYRFIAQLYEHDLILGLY